MPLRLSSLLRFGPMMLNLTRYEVKQRRVRTRLRNQKECHALPHRSLIRKPENAVLPHIKNTPLNQHLTQWSHFSKIIIRQRKVRQIPQRTHHFRNLSVQEVPS